MRTISPGATSYQGMTNEWLAEELRLWNALNDQGDRALNVLARKVDRMPGGKNKSALQQQITRARATRFAAGWQAFRSLVAH
jgi:hypothetical protein